MLYGKQWVIGEALSSGVWHESLGHIEPERLSYSAKTGNLSWYTSDVCSDTRTDLDWDEYYDKWFVDEDIANEVFGLRKRFQDIRQYVEEKKARLKEEISELDTSIKMAIVQVGHVQASDRYVRNKIKDCEEVGIECIHYELAETTTEESLLEFTKTLNEDTTLTGYIVQLPLPKHISTEKIKLAIAPEKDIDGFNPLSKTSPATPLGIINYLKDMNYEFTNKDAVVIGRSDIVGKPMARLLLNENCNVTILHSKTSDDNKQYYLASANLIVVATGHPHTITKDMMLQHDAIVFDVGINQDEKGNLCGDCDRNLHCGYQSQVPGGVGLLTRISVIDNLLLLHRLKNAR